MQLWEKRRKKSYFAEILKGSVMPMRTLVDASMYWKTGRDRSSPSSVPKLYTTPKMVPFSGNAVISSEEICRYICGMNSNSIHIALSIVLYSCDDVFTAKQ